LVLNVEAARNDELRCENEGHKVKLLGGGEKALRMVVVRLQKQVLGAALRTFMVNTGE
tara:strand:+ start:109 stop:282 length:174 start_codon:yes stop_codon:yes gene_type:complete